MRVLLIEDNPQLCASIQNHLEREGFVVDVANDGVVGEEMGHEPCYAVAILDLGLPGQSGLTVLQNWRRAHVSLPVIILTARNSWKDRVEGIDAGADDYLGKPFHLEELSSRLRALLRRSFTKVQQGGLHFGNLTLDEPRRQLLLDNQEVIPLSAMEFKLLRCFLLNRQQILSKEQLFTHLYREDAEPDISIVETHVMRLRKKIGEHWIRTVRGHGYQLVEPESSS
ncbi:MAG: response regulator transcription factor [Magnetococcales bacterium]|nr:response regulator transcription factor [Magnetococcales bacterium]MBF0114050.1 response regulator transcription factor [Magnetococcales bacterium]